MTINLPEELRRFLRAEVHCGHFASEEDALAEAVRLLRERNAAANVPSTVGHGKSDPLLGAMRDAAEEMDNIVAEIMMHRERQPWRISPSE